MPLPLPNLDDRSYQDLVKNALGQIPAICPEWTDHNPTDPGIILIELLAWLTEMVLYRLDQVPDENYWTFLKLLNDLDWRRNGDLDTAIRETVLALKERDRAVTCDDYEYLVTEKRPETPKSANTSRVKRAKCVPRINLENKVPTGYSPEDILQSASIDPQTEVSELTEDKCGILGEKIGEKGLEAMQEKTLKEVCEVFLGGYTIVDILGEKVDGNTKVSELNTDQPEKLQEKIGENVIKVIQKWLDIEIGRVLKLFFPGQYVWHVSIVVVPTGYSPEDILKSASIDPQAKVSELTEDKCGILGEKIGEKGLEAMQEKTLDEIRGVFFGPNVLEGVDGNTKVSALEEEHRSKLSQKIGQRAKQVIQQVIQEWPNTEVGKALKLFFCNAKFTKEENDDLDQVKWPPPLPSKALCKDLWAYLDERRLLTTRHHVVAPNYVPLKISVTLFLKEDAREDQVKKVAREALWDFFSPLPDGGPEGKGWPFGRDVYASEVYALLKQVPGVDYVEKLVLRGTDQPDAGKNSQGESLPSIALEAHELVWLASVELTFPLEEG